MQQQRVYFDHNATTPLMSEVMEEMQEVWRLGPVNPSSSHSNGQWARSQLTKARRSVAQWMGVSPEEIIFTSGGTEGLHLMIHGTVRAMNIKRVFCTEMDHPALIAAVRTLKHWGIDVVILPVGPQGDVRVEALSSCASSCPWQKGDLVVLSAVNHETGVRNDLDALSAWLHSREVYLLVDGVSWMGKERVHLPPHIGGICFSGHKFGGPQGTGFVVQRLPCAPWQRGGHQEQGLRAGTENLPGIVGLAKAVEMAQTDMSLSVHCRTIRDSFEMEMLQIPGVEVNGEGPRVGNVSNLYIPYMKGDALLIQLDLHSISASAGSACVSGSVGPSPVLMAMGYSEERASSSIRFSFGRQNEMHEVDYAVSTMHQLLSCFISR